MGKTPDPAELINKTDRMQADRAVFASNWQDIRDLICPLAQALTSKETPGAKSGEQVLDNTAEDAGEFLAGALGSMETPETDEIFELRTDDDRANASRDGAIWLQDTARRIHNVIRSPRGGFQQHQQSKNYDKVYFGTAGGYIAERPARGIVFANVPLQQLLIKEDSDGFVNTVHRDFEMSARNAVERWGFRVPAEIIKRARDPKKAEQKSRFIHAVCPRKERDYQSKDARDFPFASTYVSVEGKAIIADSGFHELPYQASRWGKRSDEEYGRGPGFKVLRDVRSLQRTWRITFRGAEKRIDPPLLVADDGVLSPVRTNSSGITKVRSGTWNLDPVRPLNTGGEPSIGIEIIERITERIERGFLKPLIQMLRGDRMTATEVMKVDEEQQRLLGQYLGRDKAEDLGPMIERVFWILFRAGALLPLPDILRGRDLSIEYVAPAIRMQRIGKVRALSQFNEATGPMRALDSALEDNLDKDTIMRDVGDAVGMPKTWFRPEPTVIKMREARQQQMAQQQQLAALEQVAGAAGSAAPALKLLAGGGERAAA
jgi:hypothetical protein